MNEKLQRLEAELAALQPQPPSPDLQRRIAQRLQLGEELRSNTDLPEPESVGSLSSSEIRGRSPSVRAWQLMLAACAIAACVLLALWLLPREDGQGPVAAPPEMPVSTAAPVAMAFDENLPSLWQYHRATMHTTDELDAVLDRHPTGAPSDSLQYVQIRGFGRFDFELENPSGEL